MPFPIPVEEIIGGVLTFAAGVALAWDRISKWKSSKTEKSMRKDILENMQVERESALKQRDKAESDNERLKARNLELEERLRALASEVEGLNNRLSLLSVLNTRLAATLDSTRQTLEEYLRGDTPHQ